MFHASLIIFFFLLKLVSQILEFEQSSFLMSRQCVVHYVYPLPEFVHSCARACGPTPHWLLFPLPSDDSQWPSCRCSIPCFSPLPALPCSIYSSYPLILKCSFLVFSACLMLPSSICHADTSERIPRV